MTEFTFLGELFL